MDTSLDDEQTNLAGWAQQCFKVGLLDQIIDPSIKGVISSDSLNVYVDVAIKCLHYQPKHCPTMAEVVVGLESALTLQRKNTRYPLVEITPIHHAEDVDCAIPELKDTNHSQEYEYEEEIINVSSGWNYKKQSSVRITFRKRISVLLSVTARAFLDKLTATDHSLARLEARNREKVLQPSMLKTFTFRELSLATRAFQRDSVIGLGRFGVVFKGWVDEGTFAAAEWGTGLVIAVKRLDSKSFRRRYRYRDWLTEINSLENLCHPNVVRLIGYCFEKNHPLLVYDFMPHGSLDKHLFNLATAVQSMQ